MIENWIVIVGYATAGASPRRALHQMHPNVCHSRTLLIFLLLHFTYYVSGYCSTHLCRFKTFTFLSNLHGTTESKRASGRRRYCISTKLHAGGHYCLAGEQISSPRTSWVVKVLVVVHLTHRIYVCCTCLLYTSRCV